MEGNQLIKIEVTWEPLAHLKIMTEIYRLGGQNEKSGSNYRKKKEIRKNYRKKKDNLTTLGGPGMILLDLDRFWLFH